MRAIANGQLEGFPPKEELRTVYVEHDIDASQAETPVVEFVYSDPNLQGAQLFAIGLSCDLCQVNLRSLMLHLRVCRLQDLCTSGVCSSSWNMVLLVLTRTV